MMRDGPQKRRAVTQSLGNKALQCQQFKESDQTYCQGSGTCVRGGWVKSSGWWSRWCCGVGWGDVGGALVDGGNCSRAEVW